MNVLLLIYLFNDRFELCIGGRSLARAVMLIDDEV
jgi:hypothetical protein